MRFFFIILLKMRLSPRRRVDKLEPLGWIGLECNGLIVGDVMWCVVLFCRWIEQAGNFAF